MLSTSKGFGQILGSRSSRHQPSKVQIKRNHVLYCVLSFFPLPFFILFFSTISFPLRSFFFLLPFSSYFISIRSLVSSFYLYFFFFLSFCFFYFLFFIPLFPLFHSSSFILSVVFSSCFYHCMRLLSFFCFLLPFSSFIFVLFLSFFPNILPFLTLTPSINNPHKAIA